MRNDVLKSSASSTSQEVCQPLDPNGLHFTMIGVTAYEASALAMKLFVENKGALHGEKYKAHITAVGSFKNTPPLFAITFCFPEVYGSWGDSKMDHAATVMESELNGIRTWGGSALDVSTQPVSGFWDFISMPRIDNSPYVTSIDAVLPLEVGIRDKKPRCDRPVEKATHRFLENKI
jgi:hypothetical protein